MAIDCSINNKITSNELITNIFKKVFKEQYNQYNLHLMKFKNNLDNSRYGYMIEYMNGYNSKDLLEKVLNTTTFYTMEPFLRDMYIQKINELLLSEEILNLMEATKEKLGISNETFNSLTVALLLRNLDTVPDFYNKLKQKRITNENMLISVFITRELIKQNIYNTDNKTFLEYLNIKLFIYLLSSFGFDIIIISPNKHPISDIVIDKSVTIKEFNNSSNRYDTNYLLPDTAQRNLNKFFKDYNYKNSIFTKIFNNMI